MIEIYNEVVYDLLDSAIPTCSMLPFQHFIALREDVVKKSVFVEGALEMRATTASQALEVNLVVVIKDTCDGGKKSNSRGHRFEQREQ